MEHTHAHQLLQCVLLPKKSNQNCFFCFRLDMFWMDRKITHSKEGASKFTVAPDLHKHHLRCAAPPAPAQWGSLGATKTTNTFKRKKENHGTEPLFPPPPALCLHESAALNVTRFQRIATVSLLSLRRDCQSGSKPPHEIAFRALGHWFCWTLHQRQLSRAKLRILSPGPESGAAVYDTKEPYVRSPLI